MKYLPITSFWSVVLLVALTTVGCMKDDTTTEYDDATKELQMNLSTYAADPNASADEQAVKSAYVYIYNAGDVLENRGKTKVLGAPVVNTTGDLNASWKVKIGVKKIFVVINPTASVESQLDSKADWSISDLNNLITVESAFQSELAAIGTKGMMMSGMDSYTVPNNAPAKANIIVARRHARIDLNLNLSAEMLDRTITIEKVKLSRQNHWLPVFRAPLPAEIENKNFEELQKPNIIVSNSATDYTKIISFYTGMRPTNGTAIKPLLLTLDVDINGMKRSMNVYLNTGALNGGTANVDSDPISIEANHIYNIKGTIGPKTVTFGLNIIDWSDHVLNGDIIDGSALAVSQSKVVMDWWNLGQKYDTSVDYASDGTVSFVGYVIKNADGTDKSITTDGSNLPTWLPKANITNLPNSSTKSGTIGLEYVVTIESTHPDVILRIKTGNIVKDITVVYDNGFLPNSLLATSGWAINQPELGLLLAKRGNVLPSGIAARGEESMRWSPNVTVLDAQQLGVGYGVQNTDATISAFGNEATAAKRCRSLGEAWYISSIDEISTIHTLRNAAGSSYQFDLTQFFWSSTDHSPTNKSTHNWYIYFTNGFTYNIRTKLDVFSVRCVRNVGMLSLSSTILIADYALWGNSFSTDVNFELLDGSVSVESIDNVGPTKDWLVSAVVSGTTEGKIRITYRPTAGNNGVHEDVVITLKTSKGFTKTITVKYDNGFLPNSVLAIDPVGLFPSGMTGWKTNQPPKGVQVAKRGNVLPLGVADADESNAFMPWAKDHLAASVPAAAHLEYGSGVSNTTAIITALGADAIAANKCRSLGGDWYLSSHNEIFIVYWHRNYLGTSYSMPPVREIFYWSSSEHNIHYSWVVGYPDNRTHTYTNVKDNQPYPSYVRCVRNM